MNIQIDSSVISLFHFIESGPYEALIDLIWKTKKQDDLENYFYVYSDVLSIDPSEKMKYETKLHAFNAALYFRKEVVLSIIKSGNIESLFITSKRNIEKYKYIWKDLVEKHLREKSKKKFILKHYEESSKNTHKKEFVDYYLNVIKNWASDGSSLLSQFFYVDDLQVNQIKVILKNEPVYIYLNELLNNIEASYLQDILITVKNNEKIDLDKKKAGKVPNLILQDGVFRVEPYKMLESPNILERENDFVNDFNDQLRIITPKFFENKYINSKFDYSTDVIYHGKFELATLTAIFQIGQDDLMEGVRITFTLDEICEKLGVPPSTWAYQRIARAIFYMSINLFSVNISDEKERIFHIISAIEKPIFNSDRQKEWTIEIDPVLRENVLKNLVTEFYADQIAGFTQETTAILFKTLILDSQQHNFNFPKEYTLSSLSQRIVLEGKPNQRKKRIINSLNELVSKTKIVEKFSVLDDGNKFLIYLNNSKNKKLLV